MGRKHGTCKKCKTTYYSKGLFICGYCKGCAEKRIKELEIALRRIAAIDSTNDFTDSIIDIAQQALEEKKT